MNETKQNYWIVGINLIVLIIYCLISKIIDPKDGWGIIMCLILLQVVVCFITGLVTAFMPRYKRQCGLWFLSSLLVLIIGFSTCVATFTIRI